MPALPEYKTRVLLENRGVPVVPGDLYTAMPDVPPAPGVFLKAQIPGATGRAASGLVRRASTPLEVSSGLMDLLGRENCHGVLAARWVDIRREYYAACLLDHGSADRLPGGVLLFSSQGGTGIEDRTGSLERIHFSLIDPPGKDALRDTLTGADHPDDLAELLAGMVDTFLFYRLTVLEANPVAALPDGSHVVVDCRAEFEKNAVSKRDADLFSLPESIASRNTPLEEKVEAINATDPAGTGFFRASREPVPPGAVAVATNLCGGGGKMLWEMATGGRRDIHTLNESDTSGGLSAFKSYRLLRVIMDQPEARVLFLTGSGMAFQSQYHLACAVYKALRESERPLPCLLRFGGTDQELAFSLMERVSPSLPVKVLTFRPEVFPNAMVDEISKVALEERVVQRVPKTEGVTVISTDVPPGRFLYHPDRNPEGKRPKCVDSCPTGFLKWENGSISASPDARCTGCLVCETVSLLEGNGELTIQLDIPGEVD